MYAIFTNGIMTFPDNDPEDKASIIDMLKDSDLASPYEAAPPAIRYDHQFTVTLIGPLTKEASAKIAEALELVFNQEYSVQITGRVQRESDDAQ